MACNCTNKKNGVTVKVKVVRQPKEKKDITNFYQY